MGPVVFWQVRGDRWAALGVVDIERGVRLEVESVLTTDSVLQWSLNMRGACS